MTNFALAVVGGGNMGAALVGGLLRSGRAPKQIAVVEVIEARRAVVAEMFPAVTVVAEIPRCEAAVIAVKPNDAAAAAGDAAAVGALRILSVAAGISVASLQFAVGDRVAVIRSIPNTPALVGQGAAAICAGPSAVEADLVWAEEILGAVGTVVRVSEKQLDAVTGLVGSGPAYVFMIAEALIDAGVLVGLPRLTSEALVRQLLVGSAALLDDRGDPATLRAMVTSPGGTTAAGLRVMEQHGVRSAMLEAVVAATKRSAELGLSTH